MMSLPDAEKIELKKQTEEDSEYNAVLEEKLLGAAAVKAQPTETQTARSNPLDAIAANLVLIDPSMHEVHIETETVPVENTLNSVERIKIFLKNTAITIFFSILLPTLDVFTDLRLIIYLYFLAPDRFEKENENRNCLRFDFYRDPASCIPKGWQSHWKFGTALLIPFLANYFLSWLTWARLERNKRGTWWLPALNIYPQYRAARVVTMFWTEPTRATEKKAKFEREISLGEVFIESVPTTLVMTAILPLLTKYSADETTQYSIMGPPGSYEFYWFFITFGISVFSASLGLAKCLKIGVCRTMGEGGPAGGLLSGKFLLAMLASGAFLVMKGWMIAQSFVSYGLSTTDFTRNLLVTFSLAFLPQFLLAVFSVVDFRSGNSLKIVYRQPSLLLLPTFTCFTFSRISSGCRGKADNKVKFSKIMTIMNMTVTAFGNVVWPIYHFYQLHKGRRNACFFIKLLETRWTKCPGGAWDAYDDRFGIPMILLCSGVLATFLFLFNDKMSHYCCNCWSTPQKEVVAYNPEEPETLIVLNNRSSHNNLSSGFA